MTWGTASAAGEQRDRLAGDLGILALVTALSIVLLSATGQDDSHISYWAAWVLAEHGEIANYGGQHVEQCSSLLHTLVLAALYKITPLSLPTLGYGLGIFAAWMSTLRLRTLAREVGLTAIGGLVAVAISAPMQCYWMLAGMETTLVGWIYVELAIVLVRSLDEGKTGSRVAAAGTMAAVVLVRPEGAFVLTAVVVALLVLLGAGRLLSWEAARPGATRRLLLSWLWGAVTFGLVTLFRYRYFGALFPEPVSAKIGGADWWVNAVSGLLYVQGLIVRVDTGLPLAGLLGLFAAALLQGRRGRLRDWVVPLVAFANVGFVAMAGGDWMVGGRLMVHVAPLLALGIGWFIAQSERRVVRRAATLGVVAIQLLALLQLAMRHAPGRPIWVAIASDRAIRESCRSFDLPWVDRANQTHTRDALALDAMVGVVDRLLQTRPKVTIMSGQAGMVMFYLASRFYGRIDFIDRHGLVSRHLARAKADLEIPTASTGLQISVAQYFQIAEARPEEELLPDVLFDVNANRRVVAEKKGYVCVYEQNGKASPSHREQANPPHKARPRRPRPKRRGPWFEPRDPAKGFAVEGPVYQFISVRKELAAQVLDGEKMTHLRWGAVQDD